MHACQDITSHCFPDQVFETQLHPPLRMCPGICSKETSAGSEKQSLRISWPDREEGKQHKHFYSGKGNLFYAAQTWAMTFQLTRELPAKLHHQQLMQFRTRRTLAWDLLPRSVFSLTVSFPERHSIAWKIPGYRLKSETANCHQNKTEPSESNQSVSWEHCQNKWDLNFALWFFFPSSLSNKHTHKRQHKHRTAVISSFG